MTLVDDQRRQEAHDIVAGRDEENSRLARRLEEIEMGDARLEAEHQPLAAQALDDLRMLVLELGELLTQHRLQPIDALEEAFFENDVENRIGDARRQRVAAEGRAMGAERHASGRLFRRETGADRESAAEPLGERSDVGRDARLLDGEKASDAPDSGLHLVEHEQQSAPVAKLAQRAQKFVRKDANAALALNRLDQHACRLRPDQGLDRGKIAEGRLIETVDRWAEAFEIFMIAAGGKRRERASVERALESDQPVALRLAVGGVKPARRLDRAFDRFRAGIAEEHLVGEARLDEPARKPFGLGNLIEIGDVPRPPRALLQRIDETRMAMAERIDRDARAKIEIAPAVVPDEPSALAALEGEIRAGVGRIKRRRQSSRSPGRRVVSRTGHGALEPKNKPPPRKGRQMTISS